MLAGTLSSYILIIFFLWNTLLLFTAGFRINDLSVAVIHGVLSDFCLCPWPHMYLLLGGAH